MKRTARASRSLQTPVHTSSPPCEGRNNPIDGNAGKGQDLRTILLGFQHCWHALDVKTCLNDPVVPLPGARRLREPDRLLCPAIGLATPEVLPASPIRHSCDIAPVVDFARCASIATTLEPCAAWLAVEVLAEQVRRHGEHLAFLMPLGIGLEKSN